MRETCKASCYCTPCYHLRCDWKLNMQAARKYGSLPLRTVKTALCCLFQRLVTLTTSCRRNNNVTFNLALHNSQLLLLLVQTWQLPPFSLCTYYQHIKYKFSTFLKALDICFKIFHVFNLEYPKEGYWAWLFIQKFFFHIDTTYDKINSKLITLLAEFNKENETE